MAIGQTVGAAGTDYFPLVFTNTGSAICVLQGYPGVSFVDANGKQVASAAVREGGAGAPTPVAEGSSATATAVVLDGAAGDCANGGQDVNPIAVNRFRIYPPNQTVPLYVSVVSTGTLPLPICADSPPNTLSIYALGVQPSSEN